MTNCTFVISTSDITFSVHLANRSDVNKCIVYEAAWYLSDTNYKIIILLFYNKLLCHARLQEKRSNMFLARSIFVIKMDNLSSYNKVHIPTLFSILPHLLSKHKLNWQRFFMLTRYFSFFFSLLSKFWIHPNFPVSKIKI